MQIKTIDVQKIDFIANSEIEIWDIVRPVLERQVKEYKSRFGEFTIADQWLWHNLNIGIEVATTACDAVDVEDD